MAIKDKVSGAYQDVETLNVPVNGAYQEADHANALVDGAWQEVWSSGYSFTPSIYNASYGTCTPQGCSAKWDVSVNVSGYAAKVRITLAGDVNIPANTEFDVSFDLTYTNMSYASGSTPTGGMGVSFYDADGNSVGGKGEQGVLTSQTISYNGLKYDGNPIKRVIIWQEYNGSEFSFTATISNLVVAGTKCKFV